MFYLSGACHTSIILCNSGVQLLSFVVLVSMLSFHVMIDLTFWKASQAFPVRALTAAVSSDESDTISPRYSNLMTTSIDISYIVITGIIP